MDYKKLFEKVTKQLGTKTLTNIVILFLLGILLLIGSSFFSSTPSIAIHAKDLEEKSDKVEKDKNKGTEEYELAVQNQLKGTLEKIEGVGKVELMIYFETGEEQVPAVNVNDSTNVTQEKDNTGGVRNSNQKNQGTNVVITSDGTKNEPLIVKTYKPKITGVCIVAEGAEDKVTELRITKAVMNLFNLPDNKVNVYPMKK